MGKVQTADGDADPQGLAGIRKRQLLPHGWCLGSEAEPGEMCRGHCAQPLKTGKGTSALEHTHQKTKGRHCPSRWRLRQRGGCALGPRWQPGRGCREGDSSEPPAVTGPGGPASVATLRQETNKQTNQTELLQINLGDSGSRRVPARGPRKHCFHINTINSSTGRSQVLGKLFP